MTEPLSLPPASLHVRARWRLLTTDDYQDLPKKTVTGFTFVDPTKAFINVDKLAHYIHRYRLATPAIHSYARRKFIADIVEPVGIPWQTRRQRVGDTRVEIFELSHGDRCALAVLRNWVNPVFAQEIVRVSAALHKRSFELGADFKVIWKCIIAPSFDECRPTLDQFSDIRFFKLPYIVPESLLNQLAEETGVDYRTAYPHGNEWSRNLVRQLQSTLHDLLCSPESSDSVNEFRARAGH
jgi:hypothetical protein